MKLLVNILFLVIAAIGLFLNPNLKHFYVDVTTDISPSFERSKNDVREIEDLNLAKSIAIDNLNSAQGHYEDFIKYYKWTHILLILLALLAMLNIGAEVMRSNKALQPTQKPRG